jgi:hypothetical protein
MRFSAREIEKLADWEPIVEGFEPPPESALRAVIDTHADRGFEFNDFDNGGRSFLIFSTYSLAAVERAKKEGRAYVRVPGWQVYLNRFATVAVLGRGDCLAWCPSDVVIDLRADDVVDASVVADDEARRLISEVTGFGYRFLTGDEVRQVVPGLKQLPFDERCRSPITLFELLFHQELY